MKKYIYLFLAFSLSLSTLVSCEEEKLNPESIITVDAKSKNDFDMWLDANYLNPYNIKVEYRYQLDETSSYSYYTIPADLDCSIIMAHLLKYLCVDSYDEVAGMAFTRKYFPKLFFFTGEWEYSNNGTIRLGYAEGGKKIVLTGLNYLPVVLSQGYRGIADPASALNYYYVKTIHHEFTHILNQTKDFPADFKLVTPTSYVADSWSEGEYTSGYLARGFISAYAQKEDREDFAEMVALYVTNPASQWESWIQSAGTTGAPLINAKLDIAKSYMKNTFDIDMDALRETVLRRQNDVFSGVVDLTSLEIK